MSSPPSLVWFLLVDSSNGQPYKGTSADKVAVSSSADVADFRKAVRLENSNKLSSVDAADLVVYSNKSSFDKRNAAVGDGKEEPLEEDTPMDGLGTSKKEALIVVVPSSEIPIAIAPQAASSSAAATLPAIQKRPPFQLDGIALEHFHLPRTHVVEKLSSLVEENQFVLIASPPASGKTSLLEIFMKHEPSYKFVPLSFHNASRTAMQILAEAGIDLRGNFRTRKAPDIPPNTVVLIDDVQTKYGESDFWTQLIKASPVWLPETRFVFAATYLIVGGHESPAEFAPMARVTRDHLLLQRDEFDKLIRSEIGLRPELQKEALMEMIWSQCGRLVGAVRLSVEAINGQFLKDTDPPESALLHYYLTFDVTDRMSRCFGALHSSPVSPELKDFLTKCFFNDLPPVPQLKDGGKKLLDRLKKCGILLECPQDKYVFSSPMAKRFYERYLFPGNNRPQSLEFNSLRSLMLGAIQGFSRAAIRNSLASDRFPKEALFQQLLMNSLLQCLPITHSICPELSEKFPTAASTQSQTINGEIDFYIDGDLRYGIELLVQGKEIGSHMNRFSSNGKYAPLEVKDYVVVDFRPGPISNITRYEKRMTVFFDEDYAKCQCVCGMEPDAIPLTLAL